MRSEHVNDLLNAKQCVTHASEALKRQKRILNTVEGDCEASEQQITDLEVCVFVFYILIFSWVFLKSYLL